MASITWTSHDTPLFASVAGDGPTVVFLHGGLADHRAAALATGGLLPDHRLVLPDTRGAGRSVWRGALSWELLADDLAALLDHLDLQDALVGGTSAGSGAALAFALRHPRRVRRLVLAAPVYAGTLTAPQQAAMVGMHEAAQRGLAEGMEQFLTIYDALPEPIRARARAMASTFDLPSVVATTSFLASGVAPFEDLAELAAVRCPTLVLPGTDPQHPVEVAERVAAALPDATLTEPGAELEAAVRGWGVA